VGRIKVTQVGSRKDKVRACTSRVDIDVDALGLTKRVTEAIEIVMVLLSVTEWPGAHLVCVTGARSTRTEESIGLRRIAGVDNSVDYNWGARRSWCRCHRRCCRRRAHRRCCRRRAHRRSCWCWGRRRWCWCRRHRRWCRCRRWWRETAYADHLVGPAESREQKISGYGINERALYPA